MILRKPYAFLMKHFKKINIVLFLLTIYIFVTLLRLSSYLSSYVQGNTLEVEATANLFSPLYYLVLLLILAISGVLLYLLMRKDKPIKTYIIIIAEYLLILVLSIYLHNYFSTFLIHGYDKAMARTLQGFTSIISLPQYAVLLLLVIRSIGLDLNSFGFRKDQELMADEADREEVEVEVGFDKDRFKRMLRMWFRKFGYFLREYKIYVTIASVLLIVIISFFSYRYFYVTNKVYRMNQKVSSNYYNFRVDHSYITTRNYRGDTLEKGKSFIIIDLDVENTLENSRTLDIQKFLLFVDDTYYTPTTNYNNEFSDLGPVFKNQSLKAKQKDTYFLIYEIDTPKKNSQFLLKYQDMTTHSRLIRIRLKIQDISSFILQDTKYLQQEIAIPINETETKKFAITSYEIGDDYPYTYEQCTLNNCPVYGAHTSPKAGRKILYMPIVPKETTTQELVKVFVKYGKMQYIINGVRYEEKVVSHISKVYKGNYLYFDVNEQILDATNIEMLLTIRNNQYKYIIK